MSGYSTITDGVCVIDAHISGVSLLTGEVGVSGNLTLTDVEFSGLQSQETSGFFIKLKAMSQGRDAMLVWKKKNIAKEAEEFSKFANGLINSQ